MSRYQVIREEGERPSERTWLDHSCLWPWRALRVIRTVNESQISEIHHRSDRLSCNKDRVHSVDRIGERDQSADETHVPKGDGDAALRRPLGGDPLNHPTAEEEPLTEESDTDPECFSTHEVWERLLSRTVDSRRGSSEFIQEHALLHPTYGDQIIQRCEQAVSHPVLGDAMDAGIMTHRHFRDREPVHERERRKESMQALKEPDAFQHGASKDLERAARIMDTVMRKKVSHRVRNPGGDHLHEAVLSLLSPSADEVVGGGIRKQPQDIFGVLLEIAVDLDNDLARRLPKARIKRARFAVITVEVEDAHARMFACQSVQFVAAPVAAPIVHKQNLIRP